MLLQTESMALQTLEDTKLETITQDNMLTYWRNTVEYIDTLIKDEKEKQDRIKLLSFPYSYIRREKVRLAKRIKVLNKAKHIVVDDMAKVEELIKDIPSFSIETSYSGSDNTHVTLVKGMLPSCYESRVAFLKLAHLPNTFDQNGDLFAVRELNEKKEYELNYYCTSLDPFYTDRLFSTKDLSNKPSVSDLKSYHCVHFKVSIYEGGENGIVKNWDIGLDKHAGKIFDDNDRLIMLGEPR